MIERYTPDGTLARRFPSSELIDLRAEENDEVVEFSSDLGNQLPDEFDMEGQVVTIVGIVETDMDRFGQGNAYIVRLHLSGDPEGLDAWGWFQGHNSVVVKKVLGVYGKQGVKPIRGMITQRQGANGLQPYWDLVSPTMPYEKVEAKDKRK